MCTNFVVYFGKHHCIWAAFRLHCALLCAHWVVNAWNITQDQHTYAALCNGSKRCAFNNSSNQCGYSLSKPFLQREAIWNDWAVRQATWDCLLTGWSLYCCLFGKLQRRFWVLACTCRTSTESLFSIPGCQGSYQILPSRFQKNYCPPLTKAKVITIINYIDVTRSCRIM